MIRAIGYAGICLGLPERTITRTVRLANATAARVHELACANLTDLLAILAYNVRERFCLFRINQSIVPLATHPAMTLRWDEDPDLLALLAANGAYVREHCLRVSMHPGQYTVLNSETPAVVEAARAELAYTCRVLDLMSLDATHKVVIHGGAGKPDRLTALARLEAILPTLPAFVRARLVLENDDTVFSADQLLPICRRQGIPLVFDWLHHQAQPGAWLDRPLSAMLDEIAPTWHPEDGLPKVHFSSQDPQKRPGAHAYWLDAEEFLAFAEGLGGHTVDVMAECKGKDLALIRLREQLGWETLACDAGGPPPRIVPPHERRA